MKLKIAAVAVAVPMALGAWSGVAQAQGAEVSHDRFEEGHATERTLPTGAFLRSHEQSDWEEPGFQPGHSEAGGNFTDFYVGEKGRVEFGLVTPSGQFSGQSHNP